MTSKEECAQEKFHEVDDKLRALLKEFSKFNAEKIGNINREEAEQFRNKIIQLEKEADSYFQQFVYTLPRG